MAVVFLFINDPIPFVINFMELICRTEPIAVGRINYPFATGVTGRKSRRGGASAAMAGPMLFKPADPVAEIFEAGFEVLCATRVGWLFNPMRDPLPTALVDDVGVLRGRRMGQFNDGRSHAGPSKMAARFRPRPRK
jgi:hypothetical protein